MSTKGFVHVIDDDEAVRDSVAFLFDSVDLPARTYESATVFLEGVDEVRSGCVVTDVRMPEMSGLDLLRELKARGFAPPVIVITGHGDVPLALEAVRAGAFDYLEKPFDDELLLDSVRRAMAQPVGEPDSDERARVRANLQRLSDDERQVLRGLVAGELNRAIADGLGVNTRTVDVYRAKLMAKMEAVAFADLVRMALLAEDVEN
jgi:two-component system, LuxR family, response regulator FixJ